jgi:hypothetical protein
MKSSRFASSRAGLSRYCLSLLFAGFFISLGHLATAQSKSSTTNGTEIDAEALGNITSYTRQSVNFSSPTRGTAPGDITVEIAGELRTLDLWPHDILAPDFRLRVQHADGSITEELPEQPPIYRGKVLEVPEADVAAHLVNGQLTAHIIGDPLGDWVLQPLANDARGRASAEQYVTYRTGDILPGPETCGVDDNASRAVSSASPSTAPSASSTQNLTKHRSQLPQLAPLFEEQPESASTPEALAPEAPGGMLSNCLKSTQIAFDADVEFYQRNNSSVTDTMNDITNVMNSVALIYERDLAVTYEITTILVRTAEPDPYTSTNNEIILDEFVAEWEANQDNVLTYDTAHLMTGKNVSGNVIGRAYLGVICSSLFSYGYSESRYTSNFSRRVGLTAHELGHNWDANHCNGDDDCWIMCSSINGCASDVTQFGQSALAEMFTHKASRSCITDAPGSGTQVRPSAVDDPVQTVVDLPVQVNVLANDVDGNCDMLSIGSFDAMGNNNGSVVSATNSQGESVLVYTPPSAFTGEDRFDYTASDGTNTDPAEGIISVNAAGSNVALDFFEAVDNGIGQPVTVRWRTTAETNIFGFRIRRAEFDGANHYMGDLISTSYTFDQGAGTTYQVTDSDPLQVPEQGVRGYYLEVRPNSGNLDFRGPAVVPGVVDPAPFVTGVAVSPNPRNTPVSSIQITFSEDVSNVSLDDFELNGTSINSLSGTSLQTNASDDYTINGLSNHTDAEGSYNVAITSGTDIEDSGSNTAQTGVFETFTLDLTGPTTNVGVPSPSVTNSGSVSFVVSYSDAATVNLAAGDVTVNSTGDAAAGNVQVSNGSSSNPTVTLQNITGNGTLGITISAGTASDTLGNPSSASSASATAGVDNQAPTSTAQANQSLQVAGNITGTFTANDSGVAGLDSVRLFTRYYTGNWTNRGDQPISGGNADTWSFNAPAQAGRYYFQTQAIDNAQNVEAQPSGSTGTGDDSIVYNPVENGEVPLIVETGASVQETFPMETGRNVVLEFNNVNTEGTVRVARVEGDHLPAGGESAEDFADQRWLIDQDNSINYSNADITLQYDPSVVGFSENELTLVYRHDTSQLIEIPANQIAYNYGSNQVVISNITDVEGSWHLGRVPGDRTPPSLTGQVISPDPRNTPIDSIVFTFSEDVINVSLDDFELNSNALNTLSGTSLQTIAANHYQVNGMAAHTGAPGEYTISLAASSNITDTSDNPLSNSGVLDVFTVDTDPPTVTIGDPNVTLTRSGPVGYQVSYNGAGSVQLNDSDVTINNIDGDAEVGNISIQNGSSNSPTVQLQNLSGTGTFNISIDAGTSNDAAGNNDLGAENSVIVAVDNSPSSSTVFVNNHLIVGGVISGTYLLEDIGAAGLGAAQLYGRYYNTGWASLLSLAIDGSTSNTWEVPAQTIAGKYYLDSVSADTLDNSEPVPTTGSRGKASFIYNPVENGAVPLQGEPDTSLMLVFPMETGLSMSVVFNEVLTTGLVTAQRIEGDHLPAGIEDSADIADQSWAFDVDSNIAYTSPTITLEYDPDLIGFDENQLRLVHYDNLTTLTTLPSDNVIFNYTNNSVTITNNENIEGNWHIGRVPTDIDSLFIATY